ncbi:FdhF/YdeP family oxidoreductase [Oceanimonas baumannii]|uniref:CbbBc protein n=1 Tax=Oceanimonas baumannii TaxID=129578 RepID=A0A235CID8_9GAMM|nr:FdhF/YdeP family oxidoreductase [Oceanimonas baumannii]OYD24371.1 CbbBc protein [Oceanimonas baumannii]TDW59110.1 molybdopterin-dependent oxidoreductase alpha subunit [Oceanimonas baumannii]
MSKKIKPYQGAAGGWGALASTTRFVLGSKKPAANLRNLLRANQVKGFDCPGCAWGDEQGKHFSFCENGAKAISWEATASKVTPAFFRQHPVSRLRQQSDYFLEYQGRIEQPMYLNRETDHYEPISWDEAFALIGRHLSRLAHPDQLELYTSGRASNEAAYLYQLFGRLFGTNNFPDCSNLCHEASGVALSRAIGVGKGTVTLQDFEQSDAIFVFGQNPGTNHPRMLHSLRNASRQGTAIVSFNNLKERGLERFADPQSPAEMLTSKDSSISSLYLCPRLGGDMAAVRGIAKLILEWDAAALERGEQGLLDRDFITRHTQGLDDYMADVAATSWQQIENQSGLSRTDIHKAAEIYAGARRAICTWAMGITQHKHSVATIREIVNLQLLRGQIGKPGAGLCPVRGHSNVQGNRTVGINEQPDTAFLDRLEHHFGTPMPRQPGHNAVAAIQAMLDGHSKVFIALGGNIAAAAPDTHVTAEALANCDLTVQISTKLNRSHLMTGKEALILPCLGRTETDIRASGPQFITVEDSFSMVHASQGVGKPNSPHQRSETAIIAGIAQAVLGRQTVDWIALADDYNRIRDHMAATLPGFEQFNERLQQPGGFYLGNSAAEYIWQTTTGKANFAGGPLPAHLLPAEADGETASILQTLRSHDQYNTTIYGMDDRYRGVYGQRMVLFMHPDEIRRRALHEGDEVEMISLWHDGVTRSVSGFRVVAYDIPAGNVAAYYPETNPLVPLHSTGDDSHTPTSKSIAVLIRKQENQRII